VTYALTDVEHEILRQLQKMEGRRFSATELTDGIGISPQMAETIMSSLESKGLIELRTLSQNLVEEGTLDENIRNVQALLTRLSLLSEKKESTKESVFERVKSRLNEETSKAVATLEFSVDRTHESLMQIANGIQELRDKIDEASLLVEIGEISHQDGNSKIEECRLEIKRLEEQRKSIIEAEWQPTSSQGGRTYGKKSERLKSALEELEARKLVGEFDGKDKEYEVRRNEILEELGSESEQRLTLVHATRTVEQSAKLLARSNMLLEETFNRVARACGRVVEMSKN